MEESELSISRFSSSSSKKSSEKNSIQEASIDKPITSPKPSTQSKPKGPSLLQKYEAKKQKCEPKSLREYHIEMLKKENLFADTLIQTSDDSLLEIPRDDGQPSILTTGFGMKNLKSFQRVLFKSKHKKLHEDYLHHLQDVQEEEYEEELLKKMQEITFRRLDSSLKSEISDMDKNTASSQTESVPETAAVQERLNYLMGLEAGVEEAVEKISGVKKLDSDERLITGKSTTMKKAQKYLRIHKIFEIFQFLIAHLLSAAPDNPIDFLIQTLDKCLLYRSGLGLPPLLYEKRHLEQFFKLMDRMDTGFVSLQQYKTAMATLGVRCFNQKPRLQDGMVSKEVFITEAHECLVDALNDMIKRRWTTSTKGEPSRVSLNPPPTERQSSSTSGTVSTSFSDFIPANVLWPQGIPKYRPTDTDLRIDSTLHRPDGSITEYIEQLHQEQRFVYDEIDEEKEEHG